MKKVLMWLLILILLSALFAAGVYFFNRNTGKGALQVTSVPLSKVYLNGKYVGDTPLCLCKAETVLPEGEYTVKLVPQGGLLPYEEKIDINSSVLTVVDRQFAKGAASEGVVISLEDESEDDTSIFVATFPDKSNVFLDSDLKGQSPILLSNISPSDHDLKVTKKGYKDRSVRIRTVEGKRLNATVYMGVAEIDLSAPFEAEPQATQSAQTVVILQTPTGFLRVREEPDTTSDEIGRVSPEKEFELLEERDGWYKIKTETFEGWVSAEYAQKQ